MKQLTGFLRVWFIALFMLCSLGTLSAQMNIFTLEAEADLVFGYDMTSRATGFDVGGFVRIITELKPNSTETQTGDPFSGPYVEIQFKDAFVGGYGAWGETSNGALNSSVTFDYAKLGYKNYYVKLYGTSDNIDKDDDIYSINDLFGHRSKSSFFSVQRKADKRFAGIYDTDNLRNPSFYESTSFGYYPAHVYQDAFSIGAVGGGLGDIELMVASDTSWKGFSEWGTGEFKDNRNAYAFSLNTNLTAIPRFGLSTRLLWSMGYNLYDESTVAPQKTIFGINTGYQIPFLFNLNIVPRAGVDMSWDKTVGGFNEDSIEAALGGGVTLQWPGAFGDGGENLFFGAQKVYSGITLAANYEPDLPEVIGNGNNNTSSLKMNLSVWKDPERTKWLPLPIGFAAAYEVSDILIGDNKQDLMASVNYRFDNGIWISLGGNYAFNNRENDKMDSGSPYYESNVLDAAVALEWEDIIKNMDFNVRYYTGELMPEEGSGKDWGTITTGITLKY